MLAVSNLNALDALRVRRRKKTRYAYCTIAPAESEKSAERPVAFVQRNPPPEYIFPDLFQDRQFDW